MTLDDIIRMARWAGLTSMAYDSRIQRFAELVAAASRPDVAIAEAHRCGEEAGRAERDAEIGRLKAALEKIADLEIEALRAQIEADRDYRGQCQAQAADESARRRAAEAEVERLRRDCAEAYQVLGAISTQPSNHTDDDVARALDNLHAAADGEPRPHEDLLPWPKGVA
jgi:chromosome segregation ATPase